VKEPVYEVFARKTREEPLRHIGYVNAMSDDLARVYAWTTYDEQNWIEMCVVPRSAILPVDPEESQFVHDTSVRDSEDELVHMTGTGSYGGGDVAVKEAP
jgi:1,2-phenylacetyl-CoA epoxidase PaaB subunit